jgi:hypothetical protein
VTELPDLSSIQMALLISMYRKITQAKRKNQTGFQPLLIILAFY